MNRITQQTWDQIVTQLLTAAGLVITIGNQAGWWRIGSDLQQNIIGLGTVVLGLVAGLIYSLNATPNRQVDEMVAMAYDHGEKSGLAQAGLPQQSIDPRFYKGGL